MMQNNFLTTIKTDPQGSPKNIINLMNTNKLITPMTHFETNKIIISANSLKEDLLSLSESHENSKSPSVERPSNTLSNINQLDGTNDEYNELIPETKELLNHWYDVCVTSDCNYLVKEFSLTTNNNEDSKIQNVQLIKKQLEPGVSYKLRVAGINACGKGPFSEPAILSTASPGYPGAPTNVKVKKVF